MSVGTMGLSMAPNSQGGHGKLAHRWWHRQQHPLSPWICWLWAELTPVSSQQAGFSGVTIAPLSEIADRPGEVASQSPASNLHSVLASALCV